MNAPIETPEQLAKRLEAFETPEWAIEAILDVEIMSGLVWDPCLGKWAMAEAAMRRGYRVIASDIHTWQRPSNGVPIVHDFLNDDPANLHKGGDYYITHDGMTVFMNPPFSLAEEFVRKAHEIGARKIICFQRFSWWESAGRRDFWKEFPPNRIYVCGNRATCWRFDIPEDERKSGTTTAHGWFVWERGHPPGPVVGHIYKGEKL